MNRTKFHVKKGDNVEVISGNFRGSSGKIAEREGPIHISNVRLIGKTEKKEQTAKKETKAKKEKAKS